ncbi:MAG: hypothetical protein QOG93_153, partial [Gaiellaceae bacterium]|nr:hypothetical protein [Gaiellaceae bacterium]
DGRFLHELEGEPSADAENVIGERQQSFGVCPADHLVHCVVTTDVLANAAELARGIEETCCVQAAGCLEHSLLRAEPIRERSDEGEGRPQLAAHPRCVNGDRLERAFAAHSARRRGVEVPLHGGPVEGSFDLDVHRVRGEVIGDARRTRRNPLRQAEPDRELLVVPGRSHRHRDGAAANPNLERLLDGQPITLTDRFRKSQNRSGRRRQRRPDCALIRRHEPQPTERTPPTPPPGWGEQPATLVVDGIATLRTCLCRERADSAPPLAPPGRIKPVQSTR